MVEQHGKLARLLRVMISLGTRIHTETPLVSCDDDTGKIPS
jgi:hypothetical protein